MTYRNFKLLLAAVCLVSACSGGGSVNSIGANASNDLSSIVSVSNQSGLYAGVLNWTVADLNGDGLDDIVLGGWNGPGKTANITIFIQNTDGSLTERTSSLLSNSVYGGSQRLFVADFDHDGHMDIWAPGFNDGCTGGCVANSVMLWGTSGSYIRQDFSDGLDSHGACIFDLNGDGYLDMIVRSAYIQGQGAASGYYLNNHNRSFTYVVSSNVTGGSTCSTVRDSSTGNLAILQGNTYGVLGFPSYIAILDQNLNLINSIGIASHSPTATDLIDSKSFDVNGDGHDDFVLVFNQIASGVPGSKQVWLNDGFGGFYYAYTFDESANNQYSIFKTNLNGQDYVMFDAPNGDAQLYTLTSGAWSLTEKSNFDAMARSLGGHPGIADWSIKTGLIYANRNTNKLYLMQYVNGFYTKLLH